MDTEKRIEELEQRVLNLEKMLEEKEQSKTVKEFKHSTYEKQLVKKQKKKSFTFENIEKNIGKIIGIIAACLILCGISFLAIAMNSVIIKVVIMYLISIGLLLFGKKKNYQVIQHCGYMAIYLSFFTTYGYFKLIPEIVFYILILLWLLTLFYEQQKDETFSLTGILGLTIVSIFGIYMKKELLSYLSFILLSNIFRIDTKWKKYVNSFMLIIATILYLSIDSKLTVLIIIPFIIYSFSFKNEEDSVNIVAAFCQSLTIINLTIPYIFTHGLTTKEINDISSLIEIIITAVALVLFIRIRELHFTQNIPYIFLCYSLFANVSSLLLLDEKTLYPFITFIIISIIYIFFAVREHLTNENVYKWTKFIIIGMFTFIMSYYPIYFSIVPISILIITYISQKKDLLITYILLILWIFCMNLNSYFVIPLLIGLGIQVYVFLFTDKEEKYLIILKRIFNVYLLIIVSISLSVYHPSAIKLLYYILIGFALLTVSVKECLNTNYGIIWIGLKYTAYIWYILDLINTLNLIITLTLIFLAIIFVCIGFKFKLKMLRIYSLGLTFFSCFKLILCDLSLQNTIQKAIGFIIAGSLCFLIYIIYSKMEKSI